ncbi:MAG: hypothetical protein AAF581_09800 [Planctomycetota bacterium]
MPSLQKVLSLSLLVAWATLAPAQQVGDEHLKAKYPGFAKVYDSLTTTDADKIRSLQTYNDIQAAIQNYDLDKAATIEPARQAMARLYDLDGKSNLNNVHWLLKINAIDADMSAKIADIRNHMVRDICHEMAGRWGEIHRFDFSPATNALNDIDHTFKPIDERNQTGPALKKEFNERWKTRFGVEAGFMDVVSHPFEARIPDWRNVDIHRPNVSKFVVQLREGSSLLSNNSEAYFLEGAFRMQVERRSFASKQLLYTVYTANHTVDQSAVAELHISEQRGTVGEMAYELKRPETRRSYAWGSTVGNWYFFRAHGEGLRYAAKYGIRSFAEGPGWMILPEDPVEGQPLPKTWEELLTKVTRGEFFERVWAEHYEGKFDLPKSELKWALESSKQIRLAQDQYKGKKREEIFGEKAAKLAPTPEAYAANKDAFLADAEKLMISHMKRMMLFNMEVALPIRVGDWLEPKVNIHLLFKPEELEGMEYSKIKAAREAAEKQLRVAALFESMHGLRTMEPEGRRRAIKNAIARHPRFKRTLEALLRIVEPKPIILENGDKVERVPYLFQTDEEAGRKRKTVADDGTSAVEVVIGDEGQRLDDHLAKIQPELEKQLTEFRQAMEAEALVPMRTPETAAEFRSAALRYVVDDFKTRMDTALGEAKTSLKSGANLVISEKMRTIAKRRMAREFIACFGFETRKDWRAIEHLSAADVGFNPKLLLQNTMTMANADTLVKVVQAYRKSNGNYNVVGKVILLEAASRLPVIGTLMQWQGALAGDLFGGTVMLLSYPFPGVGQAVVTMNVALGVYDIAVDVALDSSVAIYYQGTIRNEDGTAGPGTPQKTGVAPTIGMLHDVYADLRLHRRQLESEVGDPDFPAKLKPLIRRDLKDFYPLNIKGAKNHVFNYYDRELNGLLIGPHPHTADNPKVPRDEWDAMKLSTNLPTVREPYVRKDLPPVLLNYFTKVVDDFVAAKGDYAHLAELSKHPILQEQFYLSGGEKWVQKQGVELRQNISAVLTDAFARALQRKIKNPGADPKLLFELNKWRATHNEPILKGREAWTFSRRRSHGGSEEYSGEIPDAPSLLSTIPGDTYEERQRNFFDVHNARINAIIAKRTGKDRVPEKDRDRYKLSYPQGGPRTTGVDNPFLMAFFLSRIKKFRDDPTINQDTSWMGEQIWDETVFRKKLAEQLIKDYVAGLTRDITRRHQLEKLKLLDKRVPYANAVDRTRWGIWGDDKSGISVQRAEVLRLLALHSGDPHIFPDGDKDFFLKKAAKKTEKPQSIVKIKSPNVELRAERPVTFECSVQATRHYQRPFRFEWSIAGAPRTVAPNAASDSSIRYTKLSLGNDFQDLTKLIKVDVYDSSEPPALVGSDQRTVTASSQQPFEPEFVIEKMRSYPGHDAWRGAVRFGFRIKNRHDWPIKGEDYRVLNDPDEKHPTPELLVRFDYDGRRAYARLQDRAMRLPVSAAGTYPVTATVYGVLEDGERVAWQHKFSIIFEEAPPPPPETVSDNWRRQLTRSLEEGRKAKEAWQRELQAPGGPKNYRTYERIVKAYVDHEHARWVLEGSAYVRSSADRCVQELRQLLGPLRGNYMLFSDDCRAWRALCRYYFTPLKLRELDAWLAEMEQVVASPTRAPESHSERTQGFGRYLPTRGYTHLITYHRFTSWDEKKMLELVDRYQRWRPAEYDDWFNTYHAKGARTSAEKIRKFKAFYPEAFGN